MIRVLKSTPHQPSSRRRPVSRFFIRGYVVAGWFPAFAGMTAGGESVKFLTPSPCGATAISKDASRVRLQIYNQVRLVPCPS